MSENLKSAKSDDDFKKHVKEAGSRLVVVDFHALWCCHCQTMGPVFERLAPRYPLAIFLKVNVDECTDTAIGLKVKCLPSFFFFRNGSILDNYCGGDDKMLEEKIKKWYEQSKGDQSTLAEQLQVSLSPFIVLGKCECLNETPEHSLKHALTASGYLESKSSCKLMMTVVFSERIDVQSLKIQAPADRGPKNLKLFIDHPKIFDFHDAEEMKPCETLELTLRELDGKTLIPLSNPNFQYVDTLTIYVTENQSTSNKTQIDQLMFFGSRVTYKLGDDGLF